MPRIDLKTALIAGGLGSAILLAPLAAQAQVNPVLPKAGQPADTVGGGMGIRSGEGGPARGTGMMERRKRAKHVTKSHRNGSKAAQMRAHRESTAAKKVPPTSTDTTGTTVQPGSMGPAVPADPGMSSSPSTSSTGAKAPPTGPNSATGKTQ